MSGSKNENSVTENKSKGKRASFVAKLLLSVLLIVILAFIVWKAIIPVVVVKNIKKNLEETYPGVAIGEITLSDKAQTLSDIKAKMFRWYADDIDDGKYITFSIANDDWGVSRGIATFRGDVVADSYCVHYYAGDVAKSFAEATEIASLYPDAIYKIGPDAVNSYRYVKTSQCKSYEEYRNAEVVCVDYMTNKKEASFIVGFEEPDGQMLEDIKNKLTEAHFDTDIIMGEIDEAYDEKGLVFIYEDNKRHSRVKYSVSNSEK